MHSSRREVMVVVGFGVVSLSVGGCGVATAVADSKQRPPSSAFLAKAKLDRAFTAAVQSANAFGKIVSQDRSTGVVQVEKGNWILSTGVTAAEPGSRITVSARYVPSSKMDFNSRDGLTKELVALMEGNLGESFKPQP